MAELVGYGSNADAFDITAPAPEGVQQAKVMALALSDAGIKPSDVNYINAHGTSTPLNDKNESLAIKALFGEHAHKLAISSTKSMTGHLLGAAGGIELIAAVLTVQNVLFTRPSTTRPRIRNLILIMCPIRPVSK